MSIPLPHTSMKPSYISSIYKYFRRKGPGSYWSGAVVVIYTVCQVWTVTERDAYVKMRTRPLPFAAISSETILVSSILNSRYGLLFPLFLDEISAKSLFQKRKKHLAFPRGWWKRLQRLHTFLSPQDSFISLKANCYLCQVQYCEKL